MPDAPELFRVMLQVGNLDQAVAFYSQLLGIKGRVLRGSRAYFDCGAVILAIIDPTPGGIKPTPSPTDVFFSVKNVESVHERAKELKCLSKKVVHDRPAGEIIVRPWGERSFYAEDPWGNGLCFADAKTLYTGR